MKKVLEVNVDDKNYGGVYKLVKDVIENSNGDIKYDIASIEKFSSSQNIDELKKCGSKVFYIGYPKSKIIKQLHIFNNLRKLIEQNDYCAIHIHSDVANKMLICALAAKAGKAKRIILHSHATNVEGNKLYLRIMIHKISRAVLILLKTKHVACSKEASTWMFKDEKATIVTNGIILSRYKFNRNTREHIREQLGLSDKTLLIGHVGRLTRIKNHEFILKIVSQLCRMNLDVRAIFVGDGELKDSLYKRAKELNIDDRVIFYGLSKKTWELYQAMDILLLPSYSEGFPIVAVEGQASNLPMILSTNITQEVQFNDNVAFASIDNDSIKDWVLKIVELVGGKREGSIDSVLENKYSIDNTIRQFQKLYGF